MNYWI